MATGTVKWFSTEIGFGYIRPDEPGRKLFVHHSAIGGGYRSLAEGAKVSYDSEAGSKGRVAVNVQPLADNGPDDRPETNKKTRGRVRTRKDGCGGRCTVTTGMGGSYPGPATMYWVECTCGWTGEGGWMRPDQAKRALWCHMEGRSNWWWWW